MPEDRPIPGFLVPSEWWFERALLPSDINPAGFEERGALAGVQFNGFSLFQITDARVALAA